MQDKKVIEFETFSPEETLELGRKLAREARPGDVYTLVGDLGVGKTVFTQGIADGLGITEPVSSPTFTIVQVYEEGRMPFYHFDVYRIGDIEEMEEIGYDDYFYGEQTPAVIEAFNRAWLMHIHRNPHHWQHWVLINDEPKEGTILIEMPYPYIIEMVCDWWAFSWIKGDLSEMVAWYKDHEAYIKLHNNTRSIVEEILEMIRTKLTEVENAEN